MLQMKKTMALVLTLAVVAGCATNAPQVNSVSTTSAKVEAVKVTPTFDLGNKDGAELKVNLKFAKSSPFGIKAFSANGFSSANINPASFVVLKLHKQGAAGVIPVTPLDARFDGPSLITLDGGSASPVTSLTGFANSGALNAPLSFKGLNINSSYSISARVYSPAITVAGAPAVISTTDLGIEVSTGTAGAPFKSTVTINGSALTQTFSSLGLKVNDFITIGPAVSSALRYKIVGAITPTSFEIERAGASAGSFTNQPFSLWRNVVSIDGTNTGLGGGTQGAVGAPENYISVATDGSSSILGGTPPNALNMNIQLMQDLNASISGNVTATAGATLSGGETLTSP